MKFLFLKINGLHVNKGKICFVNKMFRKANFKLFGINIINNAQGEWRKSTLVLVILTYSGLLDSVFMGQLIQFSRVVNLRSKYLLFKDLIHTFNFSEEIYGYN